MAYAGAYHVSGSSLLQVGTGSARALESFGFTDNGVTIRPTTHKRRIISDVNGPEIASEMQDMGTDYEISGRFVIWDSAIFPKIVARGDMTGGPIEGKTNTPGILLGTGGYDFPLAVVPQSFVTEAPYYFYNCCLINSYPIKVGTEYSLYDLTFYSWPFIIGTALTGKDLTTMKRSLT